MSHLESSSTNLKPKTDEVRTVRRDVDYTCGIELIAFGADDIDNIIARMSSAEIDCLTFGAIQLDAAGTILQYNTKQREIALLPARPLIGLNFFDDLAPCANTQIFRGTFDAGVASGTLKALFEYSFYFDGKPRKVRIHMKRSAICDTYWIFTQRI